MARRLGSTENTLNIQDNLSGTEIGLHYRMPTTKETSAYANGMVQRKGNKMKRQLGEMRQKFGARILTGFNDGNFEKPVGEKWMPISSNPKSQQYDPDWKALIKEQASDIIEALAIHVFEVSVSIQDAEDGDEEMADDELLEDGDEPVGKL